MIFINIFFGKRNNVFSSAKNDSIPPVSRPLADEGDGGDKISDKGSLDFRLFLLPQKNKCSQSIVEKQGSSNVSLWRTSINFISLLELDQKSCLVTENS